MNLTQQTGWDKSIGDVLLESSGTVRVLEFKRATNKSTKETAKCKLLTRALEDSALAHLEPVSRQIHWYIETRDPEPHANARIIPYIDLINGSNTVRDLAAFVESTVNEACDDPPAPEQNEQYRNYFRLLWRCQVSRPSGRPASFVPVTGALVLQLVGGGQLRYAAVDDLRTIFLTGEHREAGRQEYEEELKYTMQQSLKHELRQEIRTQLEREQGMRPSHELSQEL